MRELKPYPFHEDIRPILIYVGEGPCSIIEFEEDYPDGEPGSAECDCGAKGPTDYSFEGVVCAWNRRATGDVFWGGASTKTERSQVRVTPVSLEQAYHRVRGTVPAPKEPMFTPEQISKAVSLTAYEWVPCLREQADNFASEVLASLTQSQPKTPAERVTMTRGLNDEIMVHVDGLHVADCTKEGGDMVVRALVAQLEKGGKP